MPHQRDVKAGYTFSFIFIASIFSVHYLVTRDISFTLGIVYTVAFASYIWISYVEKLNWKMILCVGVIARLLLIGGVPNLSDDFYRFLWDGSILNEGVSPYLYTPIELPSNISITNQEFLLSHLNSTAYYSVYTPLHQLILSQATSLSNDVLTQVNAIRVFFILGDVASFYLLKTMIKSRNMHLLSVLFLNPLLIMEGVGNLHVEVLTITLVLWFLYLLRYQKFLLSSVPIAVAIGLKLTPALLLPAIAWKNRWNPGMVWSLLVILITSALLFPMSIGESFRHIQESLSLYQKTFEFNASFYYVFREIGYWNKGYNIIATLGPTLSSATALFILALVFWGTWKKVPGAELMLFSWTIYLMLSTTVHPWYMLPLLPLAISAGYSYPVIWTFTVFFSYFGYTSEGYDTPFGWILAEYSIVYGILIYEIIKRILPNLTGTPTDLTVEHSL